MLNGMQLKLIKSLGIHVALRNVMECHCDYYTEHGHEVDSDFKYMKLSNNAKDVYEKRVLLTKGIEDRLRLYNQLFVHDEKDVIDADDMITSICKLYLKRIEIIDNEVKDGWKKTDLTPLFDEACNLDDEFEVEINAQSA